MGMGGRIGRRMKINDGMGCRLTKSITDHINFWASGNFPGGMQDGAEDL
jgi:hypothetical protein